MYRLQSTTLFYTTVLVRKKKKRKKLTEQKSVFIYGQGVGWQISISDSKNWRRCYDILNIWNLITKPFFSWKDQFYMWVESGVGEWSLRLPRFWKKCLDFYFFKHIKPNYIGIDICCCCCCFYCMTWLLLSVEYKDVKEKPYSTTYHLLKVRHFFGFQGNSCI